MSRSDRYCSCGHGHAAWPAPSSKTMLRRDGAVEWQCPWCSRDWLIFLLAHLPSGDPAFADPAVGAFNRPI